MLNAPATGKQELLAARNTIALIYAKKLCPQRWQYIVLPLNVKRSARVDSSGEQRDHQSALPSRHLDTDGNASVWRRVKNRFLQQFWSYRCRWRSGFTMGKECPIPSYVPPVHKESLF